MNRNTSICPFSVNKCGCHGVGICALLMVRDRADGATEYYCGLGAGLPPDCVRFPVAVIEADDAE